MIATRKRREATVTGLGKASLLRVSSDCSFVLLIEGLHGEGEMWQLTPDQACHLAAMLTNEAVKLQRDKEPWRTIHAKYATNR